MCALLLPLAATADDASISGFGTVGYARSDQPYAYLRHIDDKGTFDSDSVFAIQVDKKLAPEWSATVQLKLASSVSSDSRWDPTLAWAFVSWRPTNDWLFRAGKIRIPGYLNAENLDVGVTYDYARPPAEVYSVSPTFNVTGASFNKVFELERGDLTLDGYWGKSNTDSRGYLRSDVPGLASAGPQFQPIKLEARGLGLTLHRDDDIYVVSAHKAYSRKKDGQPWTGPGLVTLPTPPFPPGIGYYDASAGAGGQSANALDTSILYAGADVALGGDVRLAGEYVRRKVANLRGGLNSTSGYVSLRRQIGRWTPYVLGARLLSDSSSLSMWKAINGNTVPLFVPNAAFINAYQRAIADIFSGYDQSSLAIGTSYALTQTSKIKVEWMRTRVGVTSGLVDAPPGVDLNRQRINVFSLSYSFTF
ncbi:hypothetical protein B9N43_15325 [Denitratisoma sp. DHT3]|nr:hypothetical protein B9N43_15325 [Denitratisoma sp. DHT3]